jgi:hypothetical protein
VFGRHVISRLQEVEQSTSNRAIGQMLREREWERLMGEDMANSATGFAEPDPDDVTAHGRVVGGGREDEDIELA